MPPGPPGWGPPPGGPQKPNNGGAVVIVIIAAVVVLIGGGAILYWGFNVGRSVGKPVAAPTVPDISVPPVPSVSVPPLPSDSPYSPPAYSPPAPPPEHWGAIAVASDGSVGKSWDYGSANLANQKALNECPRTGCKVLVTFVNGCGAVAYNPSTNRYWGGHGDSRTAAEKAAISNAGGGHWTAWVCTTR